MFILNRLLIDVVEMILVYTRSYDAYDALTKENNNDTFDKDRQFNKKLNEINRKNRIIDKITVVKRFSYDDVRYKIWGTEKNIYMNSKTLGLDYMDVETTVRYLWGYFNNNRFINNRVNNKPVMIEFDSYTYSNDRSELLPNIIMSEGRFFDCRDSYDPRSMLRMKRNFYIEWYPRNNLPYRVDTFGRRSFIRHTTKEHVEDITIFDYL